MFCIEKCKQPEMLVTSKETTLECKYNAMQVGCVDGVISSDT